MAMIEPILSKLMASPRRRTIIITVSFGIGLVTILPLADEYNTSRARRSESSAALVEMHSSAANLDQFEGRVRKQVAELKQLEDQTVSEEALNEFRARVVSLVRESGCQVRRIEAGQVQSRDWLSEDHPLSKEKRGKKKKEGTGFELKSRPFSLSVTGSLAEVKQLLRALDAENNLVHTNKFSLRPTGDADKEVVLEIELWLLDLSSRKSVSV